MLFFGVLLFLFGVSLQWVLFAGFVVALGIFGIEPFLFIVLLYILETLIAFLQAYVFAVLTCLYLSDSFHPEH